MVKHREPRLMEQSFTDTIIDELNKMELIKFLNKFLIKLIKSVKEMYSFSKINF